MSNPILLDEVCDSAHLGIDQEDLVPEVEVTSNNVMVQKDLVPEVEVTSNNVVVPESLMQLDNAQLVELIRICPDSPWQYAYI